MGEWGSNIVRIDALVRGEDGWQVLIRQIEWAVDHECWSLSPTEREIVCFRLLEILTEDDMRRLRELEDPQALPAYLASIARHEGIRLRARSVKMVLESDLPPGVFDAGAATGSSREADGANDSRQDELDRLTAPPPALTPLQRVVVAGRREGRTWKELAEATGRTKNSLKQTLRRAVARLKRLFVKECSRAQSAGTKRRRKTKDRKAGGWEGGKTGRWKTEDGDPGRIPLPPPE